MWHLVLIPVAVPVWTFIARQVGVWQGFATENWGWALLAGVLLAAITWAAAEASLSRYGRSVVSRGDLAQEGRGIITFTEAVDVPENEGRPILSADSLLQGISTQIIHGTKVLNGFKSVKSMNDEWPKDEYKKWQEETSSILLNSARTEDHARWVRNTSIDIGESLLDDFKNACEKGLDQLDKAMTRLRILRE